MIVNIPPSDGAFDIIPKRGIALFTNFKIRLYGFKDDDKPLLYQYIYYHN